MTGEKSNYSTKIAFDFVEFYRGKGQTSSATNHEILGVLDIAHKRQMHLFQNFGQEENAWGDLREYVAVSTTGEFASWSIEVSSKEKRGELKSLAPIRVGYDDINRIGFHASFTETGELMQIEVSPYLEIDDLADIWWDKGSNYQLILDFSDGPRSWVASNDPLTRQPKSENEHEIPDLDSINHEGVEVGKIELPDGIGTIPFTLHNHGSDLIIDIERPDKVVIHIVVPKNITVGNFEKLRTGDLHELRNFEYAKFDGYLTGQMLPPSRMVMPETG